MEHYYINCINPKQKTQELLDRFGGTLFLEHLGMAFPLQEELGIGSYNQIPKGMALIVVVTYASGEECAYFMATPRVFAKFKEIDFFKTENADYLPVKLEYVFIKRSRAEDHSNLPEHLKHEVFKGTT